MSGRNQSARNQPADAVATEFHEEDAWVVQLLELKRVAMPRKMVRTYVLVSECRQGASKQRQTARRCCRNLRMHHTSVAYTATLG